MNKANQPVKSAFKPLKPSPAAMSAALAAAEAKAVKLAEPKENPPLPAPERLPANVEIWFELVDRADREVWGWTLMSTRGPKTKGVLITLNRHHFLVKKSIEQGDAPTCALLAALCLSELLLVRQKREPWIAATTSQTPRHSAARTQASHSRCSIPGADIGRLRPFYPYRHRANRGKRC